MGSIKFVISLFFLCIVAFRSFPAIATQEDQGKENKSIAINSSTLEPILISPIFFELFETIEQDVEKRYPKFFLGSDKLNWDTIGHYRMSWLNFVEKNKEIFSVLHNSTLLSALEQLERDFIDYAQIYQDHTETINRFIREIRYYRESESVSPSWFEKLPFRFLCAISTVNLQERDFTSHLAEPYPTIFLALQENQAWKNHESTVTIMDGYNKKLLDTHQYFILSDDIIQEIKEIVEKSLPKQIIWPIWGRGQIGVAFIVKAMLDNIFLVGVPLKNQNVHGISSSPYGFAVHDLFHMSVDHRHFSFIQHIIDQGEKYVKNGGSIQKFLSIFIPAALAKYQAMMNGLKEIYQRIICTFDQPESRKAMLGFFWVLHEEPNFPGYLYTVRNFDDILTIITEDEEKSDSTINVRENDFSTELLIEEESKRNLASGIDSNDHFKTSPLNGISQWTDEEIIEWVLKNKKIRESRKYELIGYFGQDEEPINPDDIVAQSIKRSSRYIDVIFTLRQGGKLAYSFQTLFYNMQATHNALSILELIDIKTNLPDLSLITDSRAVAQAFIKKGEKDINSLITCFRKTASNFANEDIPGKGSLVERYKKMYDESNISLL